MKDKAKKSSHTRRSQRSRPIVKQGACLAGRCRRLRENSSKVSEKASGFEEIKLTERLLKLWAGITGRDLVATVLGSVLLLEILAILALSMIFDRKPPEVLNSAFLIILGYFFGEVSSRRKRLVAAG